MRSKVGDLCAALARLLSLVGFEAKERCHLGFIDCGDWKYLHTSFFGFNDPTSDSTPHGTPASQTHKLTNDTPTIRQRTKTVRKRRSQSLKHNQHSQTSRITTKTLPSPRRTDHHRYRRYTSLQSETSPIIIPIINPSQTDSQVMVRYKYYPFPYPYVFSQLWQSPY